MAQLVCNRIRWRSRGVDCPWRPHDGLQHEYRRQARALAIAPDETTFAYLQGRRFVPQGDWDKAVARWRELPSDAGAQYDRVIEIDAAKLSPFVTGDKSHGCANNRTSPNAY
jgi:hypothetical protein